jgi:CBS domain-containing protein
MSNVRDVLYAKSSDIFTIDEEKSIADAITQMVERGVGSLIVTTGGVPVGMFTERDVLKVWKGQPGEFKFKDIPVSKGMTKDPIVVSPKDDIDYLMSIMTKNRIRHLPVVDEDRVVGMISIRDVVRAQVTNLKVENHYLKEYISGKFV